MHHRQDNTQCDEEEKHFVELILDVAHSEFFQKDRRKLDPHNKDVKCDAGGHFKHHRIGIDITGPENVPEIPPAAKVNEDATAGQCVAEKTGQQRWPHQRVVLPFVENINQQGHRETAAGQCRADHHIDHDPDAPGIAVIDVGHRAQTKNEAHQQDGHHDGDEDATNQSHCIDQVTAHRRRTCMLLSHGHFSPVPWAVESSSASWTFFLAMKLSAPSTASGMIRPP